jgi:hypothetical protein
MQNPFSRSKCFPLIRFDLALHIVPRIRYLGFTLKGRKVPWLWRRTCLLASPNELWYNNQPSTSVRPSPSLCHHPRHYSVNSSTVEAWGDGAPPRPPLCSLRSSVSPTLVSAYGQWPNEKLPHHHPWSRSWTRTWPAMTPARSEILKDRLGDQRRGGVNGSR